MASADPHKQQHAHGNSKTSFILHGSPAGTQGPGSPGTISSTPDGWTDPIAPGWSAGSQPVMA